MALCASSDFRCPSPSVLMSVSSPASSCQTFLGIIVLKILRRVSWVPQSYRVVLTRFEQKVYGVLDVRQWIAFWSVAAWEKIPQERLARLLVLVLDVSYRPDQVLDFGASVIPRRRGAFHVSYSGFQMFRHRGVQIRLQQVHQSGQRTGRLFSLVDWAGLVATVVSLRGGEEDVRHGDGLKLVGGFAGRR